MTETLVIGVGNPDRGDDAAGRAVVRCLRRRGAKGLRLIEHGGEAASLIAAWEGAQHVVLVDAAQGAGAPGSVERFDARRETLPLSLDGVSSHALGVATAVELARSLGRLPAKLRVYAILGSEFGRGRELSAAVRQAVVRVAEEIGDGG